MEGEPEEPDKDVQPTVLWERSIQQSIFIDLSEDESLHLSDFDTSLGLRLSQGESAASEASIHLSGSAELSNLDVTSSESSPGSSGSEKVVESKSSMMPVSAQRPNTMQDVNQVREDPGQSTSDEDQEDLPYDGVLGSPYFNQTTNSEGTASSDGRQTVHASPEVCGVLERNTRDRDGNIKRVDFLEPNSEKPATFSQQVSETKQGDFLDASLSGDVPPCPADLDQLLQRHFSNEELLLSGRLIEAETLPEVSLLESMDDTVYSRGKTHNSAKTSHSESLARHERSESLSSGTAHEKSKSAASKSLKEEAERKLDKVTSAATDSLKSSSVSADSEQGSTKHTIGLDVAKQEKAEEEEEDGQVHRVPLVRARSFSEMKYGQGQVHYPLPDFSKVAPKVKIPKAPSGPTRAVPQSPGAMHRAQSSPGMLDLISRVLEDTVQPAENPYVFTGQDKREPPTLEHHLQAEYDKLLTKYAEAENLIDKMRIGTNQPQPSSELMLYLACDEDLQGNLVAAEGSHLECSAPPLLPSENFRGGTTPHRNIKEVDTASSSQPEEVASDGERMTAELRDIISQFMQKVEEFRLGVRDMSMSTAEQQMVLRSFMDAQDHLERKYISKKEEHRALEMQNYMGLSRNTGTFDPDRLVEGDIFRIGMYIEDIKEMIDKNVCEQISPPHSSSTPTPMNERLRPSPLRMPTPSPSPSPSPSPPQSLHEGPVAAFSTAGYNKSDTWRREEKGREVIEAGAVHRDDGLQKIEGPVKTDFSLENISHRSCHSRSSRGSVERHTPEAEHGSLSVSSEALDHSNILAYFSGTSSPLIRTQWTPDSRHTPESALNSLGECDEGDCVSLAVEVSSSSDAPRDTHSHPEPPLNTSSVSQRIITPETDSGFGSSYLNQSASGSFQPDPPAESVQTQNDGLSSSDSEGSCSNLRTAIHPASIVGQRWASPHPSVHTQPGGAAAAAVERWVESTTKEPSVGLQDPTGPERSPPEKIHQNQSEPVLSMDMDTEERSSPQNSCSCNSEAILALQSEVSRLKQDLQDGLVQLPHLAQKMDYLTSKCRQDRHERRSKTKARTHRRSVCSRSSDVRIEDWISSDMDPSKSKGTDSGDTAGSEIMVQFHSLPAEGRRGSGSTRSTHEFQYNLQSNRGSEGTGSVRTSGLKGSILKGGKEEASDSYTKQRKLRSAAVTESFYSRESRSLLTSPSLQKPLLQVGYGSSSSLPASYKVREPPLESTSHHRKRSTQSDTALLPSNVYFQRTFSTANTGRRRGSKEEEMNRTLDKAIEMAYSMKRTTDRMARRLSADLTKAQLQRKPLGGRKHHALKQAGYTDQITPK